MAGNKIKAYTHTAFLKCVCTLWF